MTVLFAPLIDFKSQESLINTIYESLPGKKAVPPLTVKEFLKAKLCCNKRAKSKVKEYEEKFDDIQEALDIRNIVKVVKWYEENHNQLPTRAKIGSIEGEDLVLLSSPKNKVAPSRHDEMPIVRGKVPADKDEIPSERNDLPVKVKY